MFAIYNLKIQTGYITEIYLHAGVALSPVLPTYRYLQSVVKPEPQLLCMRPSASLYLFLFNGNAYLLPLIPSGPVLSRCSSFDIYGSYMYIGYKEENKVLNMFMQWKSPVTSIYYMCKTFIQQFDRLLQFYL